MLRTKLTPSVGDTDTRSQGYYSAVCSGPVLISVSLCLQSKMHVPAPCHLGSDPETYFLQKLSPSGKCKKNSAKHKLRISTCFQDTEASERDSMSLPSLGMEPREVTPQRQWEAPEIKVTAWSSTSTWYKFCMNTAMKHTDTHS